MVDVVTLAGLKTHSYTPWGAKGMCENRSHRAFKSLDGEVMDVCDSCGGRVSGLGAIPMLEVPESSPVKRKRGRPKGTYAAGSSRGKSRGGEAKMPRLGADRSTYLGEADKCSTPRWVEHKSGKFKGQCRCKCSDRGNASILSNEVCMKLDGPMKPSCKNHPDNPDRKKRSGKKRG